MMPPEPPDPRLVVVMLRGGMDALAVVPPYGDPALPGWRGGAAAAAAEPGSPGGALDLDGFFGLHPALSGLHGLFAAGEALVVHGVAGHHRSRSHFHAQDALELGPTQTGATAGPGPGRGWLNRLAGHLPPRGPAGSAIAIGPTAPISLLGPVPVAGWSPPGGRMADGAPRDVLAALHDADPLTGPALRAGLAADAFAARAVACSTGAAAPAGFPGAARAAGMLLARPDGPRVAALDLDGWDTHAAQDRQLPRLLRVLDEGLMALRTALGPAWSDTVVLAMTEFGRTVALNGCGGTDHGTASAAFVLGGAVAGGRVVADWPGLGRGDLFEGRDLRPTRDLGDIQAAILREHMRLSAGTVRAVLPHAG